MITGIILASGYSRRMKRDKLLLELNGVKMIERVVMETKASILNDIILIYRKEEVKEIGEKYNVKVLFNPNAYLGLSASMKLGVTNSRKSDAYMFIMGDQPFINSLTINKLINEYEKFESEIVIPCYNGKNGTPTIFSSTCRNDLLAIEGDKGGREIIRSKPSLVRKVNIANKEHGLDIDTPIDYKKMVINKDL